MPVIPRLNPPKQTAQTYLDYLSELEQSSYNGDYSHDYGSRLVTSTDNSIYQVLPQCIVYPKTTGDLSIILEIASCGRFPNIKLTPRGGGTGTNGQSLSDGVIVDFSRHMNKILEMNLDEGWVQVQPGVVLDQLNDSLKAYGFFFPPTVSPSNRATLGGMINTDACGKGSRVYGKTSDHILEIHCVLSNGELFRSIPLDLNHLELQKKLPGIHGQIFRTVDEVVTSQKKLIHKTFPKLSRFMTGYNLAHVYDEKDECFNLNFLLSGSEGTLALVSEARLQLTPLPTKTLLLLIRYETFEDALRDATRLVESDPTAIETIDEKILSLAQNDEIYHKVKKFLEDTEKRPTRTINLVEFSGNDLKEIQVRITQLCKNIDAHLHVSGQAIGYYLTDDLEEISDLWDLRKKGVGLLGNMPGERKPLPFVEDTAVPPEKLEEYIREFRDLLDKYELQYGMYGHIDVGCLHVRPALDLKDPHQETWIRELSDQVRDLVIKYGGIMWAEHGRGYRSEYTIDFFGKELHYQLRRIKEAFDPQNRLNPGKIVAPLSMKNEVVSLDGPLRGHQDRQIDSKLRQDYRPAMECNGNGACFDYADNHIMCPSSRITKDRLHSPKGRASVLKEWLRLLSLHDPGMASSWAERTYLTKAFFTGTVLRETLTKFFIYLKGSYELQDYSNEVYRAMDGCLACKACATKCPIHVDIPSLRSKFLYLYHSRYFHPLKDYLVGSLEWTGRILSLYPGFFNKMLASSCSRYLIRKLGLTDLPRFSDVGLSKIMRVKGISILDLPNLKYINDDEKDRSVILIQDAFSSFYDANLVILFQQLLKKLGFRVHISQLKINGKPLHVKGFIPQFIKIAEANARYLSELSSTGIPLVGIEPSIVLTYRDEYPKVLNRKDMGFSVMLPQELLQQHLGKLEEHAPESQTTYKILGHCMEKTGAFFSQQQWIKVFEALGQKLELLEVGCCGMAGTYGHETSHFDESKGIYELSWKSHVTDLSFPQDRILVTGFSCRSQIERFESFKPYHPIHVIHQMLGKNCERQ